MRLALAFALILVSCAKPDATALYGTWQSNEALTLKRLANVELTEKQRELFEQDDFFGELRVTYEEGRILTEYQGSRAYAPYKVLSSTADSVVIEYMDPVSGEMVASTLLVRGDQLWFPVRDLGFHEVFLRSESSVE